MRGAVIKFAMAKFNESKLYNMASKKLALFGGEPTLKKPLPVTNNIKKEELAAATRVLKSGVLSDFVGRAGEHFLGGKEVKKLEAAFVSKFKVRHAVSFNSATTALEAAFAALELPYGSEVIVSPYTMAATATAILVNNLTPIFADISRKTFCLDPRSVEACVTPKTRAIAVTNLFGGGAEYDELLAIAKRHHLKIVEDNAQAPAGTYKGKFLGTVGDIGVFSFNFHKVMHCGEGGVLVTNNDEYAFGAQLKRNHGEVVLDDLSRSDKFIIGSNYRMTELHAAIAAEQLKKIDFLNKHRISLARHLSEKLRLIPGITPSAILQDSRHVFYVYPFLFDAQAFGLTRQQFVDAMAAEGFPLGAGYQKPLYLLDFFKNDKTYQHLPFLHRGKYTRGICPIVENLYNEEMLYTTICRYPLKKASTDLFIAAARKIYDYRTEFNV